MTLKGNLQDFSTTQLLNLVHLARKTGSLQLNRSANGASASGRSHSPQLADFSELYFQEGKLVHAVMTGYDGLLTSMLVRSGKMPVEQAKAVQQRAEAQDDRRLAMILIQNGYLTKEDVVQSVTRYIQEIVYHLFTWTEGKFHFEPNKQPDKARITVPIDLANVIMEGTRRIQEWERLQDELPDLNMALKFTDRPDAKLRNISLTPEEWKIISYVKPSNSIRQIAQVHHMSDLQIRKIVYGMLQAGLVELIKPPSGARPTAEMPAAAMQRARVPAVKRGIVNRLIERIKQL